MDWFFSYWSLFARQTLDGDGLLLLQNPNLPLLEVNAGYGSNLNLLQTHTAKLERPCLLVSNQPQADWEVLQVLTCLEWQQPSMDVYIEQVAWTQASLLAQAWCDFHRAQTWHALVALEIAQTMQKTPDLCAYLALSADKPIGMLLAMPKNGWWHNGNAAQWFSSQPQGAVSAWWAGERHIAEALFARASADFARLEVAVPKAWGLLGKDSFVLHKPH